MTELFREHNISAVAVHSGEGPFLMERQKAMNALLDQQIEIIFSVDQFNEGVDIPEVDLVMFLRPTESYTIFLQQLGRGLRKASGKDYLTVLDFIGNYKRAHLIPLVLRGQNLGDEKGYSFKIRDLSQSVAEGCLINFDLRLLDVFKEMRKHDPLPERMKNTYWRLKKDLGKRPWRIDIHAGSDIVSREFFRPRHLAPHRGYLRFLADLGELSLTEKEWLDTEVEEILLDLETTPMTKLYKIPTIQAFVGGQRLLASVSSEEIGRSMQAFYRDPRLYIDMGDKSSRNYREWILEQWTRLAEKNPIKFLDNSSKFFQYDQINKRLRLVPVVFENQSPVLIEHLHDILLYRKRLKLARLYKNLG